MPKSYTRISYQPCKTEYFSYAADGTQSVTIVNDVTYSQKEDRSFKGSSTANYRSFRSANGYLPTLACTDSLSCFQNAGKSREAFDSQGRLIRRQSGTIIASITQPPLCPPELTNQVWSKVRQKVLDQDFNAPVFLAEGTKTVDMMVQTARRITLAYVALKKGRLSDVRRHLKIDREGLRKDKVKDFARAFSVNDSKGLANAWLEYKYGWLPLLHDIHGAAKHLAESPYKKRQSTIRAVEKRSAPCPTLNPVIKGALVWEAKAWVTVRINSPSTSAANRLGLLNPLLVAWELLPFSFVADWFVNVGDCISELTAFNGVSILTGGSSTRTSIDGIVRESNPAPYTSYTDTRLNWYKYSRIQGVQTMPRLMIKSNPLSLAKLTTAVALMRQAK